MKTKEDIPNLINSKYLIIFMNFYDDYINLKTLNCAIDEWTTSLSKELDKDKKDAEEIENINEFLTKELSKDIKKFGNRSSFKKLYDYARIPKYETTMRNMILIYLVTIFENYVEEILNATYHLKPLPISEEKSINFEELKKCKDKEEAIQFILNKEIKNITKKGIDEGIEKYISEKLKIKIKKFDMWVQLKERFYRRNLIVHNKGIIDNTYVEKTGYKGTETKLEVTKKYLIESFNIFEKIAIQLMDVFHEKFEKK